MSKSGYGRILITNDDGIHAPGLTALEAIAASLSDDVWVFAPEAEQSGASHSLTLSKPMRLRQISPQRFAVDGTPTDCVMMAVNHVLDGMPDLVLSGINRGQNMAEDVTYSGTIAGAMEGTTLGIRSIALSQAFNIHSRGATNYTPATRHGPVLLRRLLDSGWPPEVLLNINFPDLPDAMDLDTEITRQGRRHENLTVIDERRDPRGVPYYWFGFKRETGTPADGTDLCAVYGGRISVTPLHLDLTNHEARAVLEKSTGG